MNEELSLEELIWQLKNSQDPDERLYAAFKLGRLRDSQVVQPLLAASTDPDASVRVRVAEALGTRDETTIAPALIQLIQDEHVLVRRTAAISLGRLGDLRGLSYLAAALKDSDETVRSHAAEALGEIHADESASPLVEAFLYDEDANVRYFAKQSLGQVGAAAVEALLAALDKTDDPILLSEICEILGTLGDSRARFALENLQSHQDSGVAEMAMWALKSLN